MRLALLVFSGLAFACSACELLSEPQGLIPRWTSAWRQVATDDDKDRLRDWRAAFTAGLDGARKAGHSAEIAREGALLEPDAALGSPAVPNGMYRCRVIKLGAKAPGNLDYVPYPAFACRVQPKHNIQELMKLGGSQRYVGLIFPGDAIREVFLGTLVLGDETRALQYGQDETRDVAGYVERIGPRRWRLILPKPHFESQLDVMELVPLTE